MADDEHCQTNESRRRNDVTMSQCMGVVVRRRQGACSRWRTRGAGDRSREASGVGGA
jgi:hypothetical protein